MKTLKASTSALDKYVYLISPHINFYNPSFVIMRNF